MDLQAILLQLNSGNVKVALIAALIGSLPWAISFFLPRKKTISWGKFLYNSSGKFLAQTRNFSGPKLIAAIRTTLVDLSFGIYIASKGYTKEEEAQKIDEYLGVSTKKG